MSNALGALAATSSTRPKPRISLADVVAAGVAIADTDGMAALSMRKVASSLGVGAMSLYTYVPGRSELVELMIDRVYGEHASPIQSCRGKGRTVGSRDLADLCCPSVAAGLQHGAASGRAARARCFRGACRRALAAGFTGAENVAISNLIQWQLLGAARSMISDADEARHTGVSAEAYWDSRASFWVTYFDWTATQPWPPSGRPAASTIRPAGTLSACWTGCSPALNNRH